MQGVNFGNYHSYVDLNLILSSKTIGEAKVKKSTVDIPGGDGNLDLTEFFGEPRFENRLLTFNFSSIEDLSSQPSQYSNIQNLLNGQLFNIVLDSDPDYYYVGRLEVGDWINEKCIGKLVVKADCNPWKYKSTEKTVTRTISSSTESVVLVNSGRKSLIPLISVIASSPGININWDGGSATLSTGNNQIIPNLILREGNTPVTISGSGTISFKYREAIL